MTKEVKCESQEREMGVGCSICLNLAKKSGD